jgi:hypothetical protein
MQLAMQAASAGGRTSAIVGAPMRAERIPLADAATPLNDRLYSDSAALRAIALRLTDEIEADPIRLRRMRGTAHAMTVRYVSCLITNFLVLWLIAPTRRLTIPRDSTAYADSPYSYGIARAAVDYLAAFGYLSHARGYYDRAEGSGKVTQFWPTGRFNKILATLDHIAIAIRERKPLVWIRQSKRTTKDQRRECAACQALKAPQSAEYCAKHRELRPALPWPKEYASCKSRYVATLRRINKALASQYQAVRGPDALIRDALSKCETPINIFASQMHRVFTNSPQLGGRFAGAWWFSIPNQRRYQLRGLIMMAKPGDKPARCVELDFEGMHARMLYARVGVECVSDPYKLHTGAPRKLVKGVFLKLINASSPESAMKAVRRKIRKELYPEWLENNPAPPHAPKNTDEKIALIWPGCPPLAQVVSDILAKHQPIARYLGTGAGWQLMFADAEIAEGIMLQMLDETGICPLPVHDSFIVPEHLEGKLREIMQRQFVAKCGVEIPINRKPQPEPYTVSDSDLYSKLLKVWADAQAQA